MLSPQLLGNVLESAPDAIVIVDSQGRIVFVNAQLTALLGFAPHELIGQSVDVLLPERLRAAHRAHRASYAANARVRPMGANLELHALRKDASEVPVEISLSPIREGSETLVAAAIRDVTERKRIQTELMHAREAAERANQAKSRFLGMASHDLRQPLQSLALLCGTLRRIVQEPLAAEALAHQSQAIESMSRLLNALLDVTKLESGAVRPGPRDFALGTLLEEMRTEFAGLAAGKGLELRVEPTASTVHSDPSLVSQVLRNLVSNAVKYTERGWVRVRALANGAEVRIEVVDTGIGIPADELPYIYDEFYQVGGPANTVREGYGLGLSIVQRLVRLLGLKLEVHSEVGRGSTFTLVLPAAAGATASAPPASTPPVRQAQPPSAPTVLLVDDDVGVRNATAMLLKVEGYGVIQAESLAEAVRTAGEYRGIALLITDYHLRENENGSQVIAAVREVLGQRLGAVLITGDTSASVRALKADERTRLASKPINADELLVLLRDLAAPAHT